MNPRKKIEMLDTTAQNFHSQPVQTERLVESVLRVLEKHVSEGEIRNIASTMPKDLKELWPVAV